jgi:hypothetical protein
MKLIKALSIGMVLTTLVSCSSLDINDLPAGAGRKVGSIDTPSTPVKPYQSVGIYSPGDKLRGDLLLEQALSDVFYQKKMRTLTSSLMLPGTESRELPPVVKILKRDKFEALLIIKKLEIVSEATRSPSGTIGNNQRGTLLNEEKMQPLRTLTAEIEFVDLKSKNTVWSGNLTFQDTEALPILIQKTADGIANYLTGKSLVP